jgi:uncharacterized alkaline shock family protein YloU
MVGAGLDLGAVTDPLDGASAVPSGGLTVADRAVAGFVREVACSCYGVRSVGTGRRPRLVARWAGSGRHRERLDGVTVTTAGGRTCVELSVTTAAGVPSRAVVRNLSQLVVYRLERLLGTPVDCVAVSVGAADTEGPTDRRRSR